MARIILLFLAVSLSFPSVLRAQEEDLPPADVDLHYELSGEGPPLVLIHGWTHDLRSWDMQLPALERRFEVLRYDRRGWGQSGGRPDVSMDPVDLDRLMADLGIESAFVLGHSQGARVALRFALAYPDRVQALGLYGSPPPEGFGLPFTGPDTFPSDMSAIARQHGLDSLGTLLFNHPLARGFEEGRPGAELAARLWASNAGRELLDPRPPSGATPPPRTDHLGRIDVPTLVITGEWELPYFMVVADALAYGITDAERVTIPGGGHAVHMQEPERFNAEVVRFFERVGER